MHLNTINLENTDILHLADLAAVEQCHLTRALGSWRASGWCRRMQLATGNPRLTCCGHVGNIRLPSAGRESLRYARMGNAVPSKWCGSGSQDTSRPRCRHWCQSRCREFARKTSSSAIQFLMLLP